MEDWFGLNPLDVILGTVAFSTVALAVREIYTALRNHRARKPTKQKDIRHIDLPR